MTGVEWVAWGETAFAFNCDDFDFKYCVIE
jgi:hypothetical protein